jgi:glycosyltransferase involved in cell wall biosynthesis
MKVLQLGPYPPPHGGVQTNLVAIRQYLREHAIECDVINLTGHRQADADGVYYPKNAAEVLRLLWRIRCEIVHLHIGGDLQTRLLWLGFIVCMLPGRRTVLTFHSGGYPGSAAGQTARPATFRGFVLRRFDALIAVNQQLVDLFRRFGAATERIHLIYPHAPGIADAATSLPSPLEEFFAAHQPLLLTISGLEPEYDLPLQIETLGRVRERFPKAGLVIIGGGSLEREVRNRIGGQPWADNILLCGDLPHAATLRALADCDIFLRTTLYDGDSISVREALHLGTPVIATDNGMRPPGVDLIPVQDADALFAAIERRVGGGLPRPEPAAGAEENLAAVLALYEKLTVG